MTAPITNTKDEPFQGEFRESKFSRLGRSLAPGETAVLATLASPWVYIGFLLDPGDAQDDTDQLQAFLRVLEPGLMGTYPAVLPVPNGSPQAFGAFTVGARCELVVHNGTDFPITGLRGQIWGMTRSPTQT